MNSYLKTHLATVACILVGAFATAANAQITRGTQILPMLSPQGLTDLNNVILFRSNHAGNQAFDGALDADQYIVGPGDEIEVNVWTPSARSFLMTVTPDGTLLIPAVGELFVSGLHLTEARNQILNATAGSFPESEISATLITSRRVRVYVSGLVRSPGTYELAANQRVGDAIAMAGDILSDSGSARNITVKNSQGTRSLDLLKFYAQGDIAENPYLSGGDHIRVLPREPEINQLQVAGAVLKSGRLEFRQGDRVSDLIAFAYGVLAGADLQNIVVAGINPELMTEVSRTVTARISSGQLTIEPDLELARGDHVFVSFLPHRMRTATVAIYGEVLRPGHYGAADGITRLSELIESAGGLLASASPHEMVFMRNAFRTDTLKDAKRPQDPNNLASLFGGGISDEIILPRLSTSLTALLAGDSTFDVALADLDSIFIPRVSPGVQMIGRVRRPGILSYVPNESVDYYLNRAGGYAFKADKGNVRIIRAVTGAEEKPGGELPPQPGDQIFIPIKDSWSTGRKIRNIITMLGAAATTYLAVESIVD